MRRDARVRRDALIERAAASFAERGYGVALEDIAAQAGVGRGTLYRNFADREALALAIFERDIDQVDDIVAQTRDFSRTMRDLAIAGSRSMALFGRIAVDLVANSSNMAAFEALGERFCRSLEPLAARARAEGAVGPGVDGQALALGLRMVGGVSHNLKPDEASMRLLDDAVDLVLRGLSR